MDFQVKTDPLFPGSGSPISSSVRRAAVSPVSAYLGAKHFSAGAGDASGSVPMLR